MLLLNKTAHTGQAVKNIETVKVRNVVEVDVSKGVAVARVTNALEDAGDTTVSFTTAVEVLGKRCSSEDVLREHKS